MSIPPLVCNTPPPPDQCEDDRDTEDFDIHYNLSQDDEDDSNDYSYGTYSNYIYSTSTSTNIHDEWSRNISKKADNNIPIDILKGKTQDINVLPESSSVNKIGYDDIVIEDLNLKVEDENNPGSSEHNVHKFDTEPSGIDCSSKDTHSAMATTTVIIKSEDDEVSMIAQDFALTNSVNDDEQLFEEHVQPYIEETVVMEVIYTPLNEGVKDGEQVTEKKKENHYETYLNVSKPATSIDTIIMDHKLDVNDANVMEGNLDLDDAKPSQNNLDHLADELSDFDDFQFISSENNPAHTIEYCDNPWDSEVSRDCEFGDFTANFDGESNLHTRSNDIEVNEIEITKETTPADAADDFGDFDDFQSSSNEYREEPAAKNETSQNVPVFSLYSPDSEVQIIESINSVLKSIFTSELSEDELEFEAKLESLLNETWGYLVDTDIRQPYIVNWNNSLGQKSLLKALCIDSRNILFGPKWHIGMPKYAANLTVAPLQPQKPLAPVNATSTEDSSADKTISKDTGTWIDPFTSNGQESCNTEDGTSGTSRPTNLDVFTNVTTPEMNKIYSSALNVQPIHQINLPDTHIFTPTDSETPRSKTIHYNPGPTVLVPQRSEEIQTKEVRSQTNNKVTSNNSENDEEYWEFQDFKGPISNTNATTSGILGNKPNETTTNNSTLPVTVDYQAQILQPIKVVPILPALNWPAPGEVKETFDDFSDFVSNSAWNDNSNTANHTGSQQFSKKKEDEPISTEDTLDNDFETFQSAPTLKAAVPLETAIHSTANINHHNFSDIPKNLTTTNISPSTHSKTDHNNTVQTKETTNSSSAIKISSVKSSPVLSSASPNLNTLLQPSIASTSGSQKNHKKTGQILQPLSLESYSQINWPNPGIDLQDLSRFNPVESLQSLKTDATTGGSSKLASPVHKDINAARTETTDDDIWGDFVSSKPKPQQSHAKKLPVFADDDEWTDFVSSPSVKPQNGLNTISFNVHTHLNMQKSSSQNKFQTKNNQISFDIPTLNYVTPKSNNRNVYNDKHFQNL